MNTLTNAHRIYVLRQKAYKQNMRGKFVNYRTGPKIAPDGLDFVVCFALQNIPKADAVLSLLSAISTRILPTGSAEVGILCIFINRISSLTGIRLSLLPGMR